MNIFMIEKVNPAHPDKIADRIAGAIVDNVFAGMAELADAPDLGSGVPDVQVQVLLPAPAEKSPQTKMSP